MKHAPDDILSFAGSSFRSIWALELLLLLKRETAPLSEPELVVRLRASDLVVSNAVESLVAAGLATHGSEGITYRPINDEIAARVDALEILYAERPDAVRRAIISASTSGAAAFADAFRLRKD